MGSSFQNVAVAIPALPNASPLACRAPVNPPPPVKTIIKVLMSSKSSINTHNTHGGLESMLQDIKTGRSKVPINMNSTVGTETFGNDKQFRDLIKNGPDASGSRRTSKRKTRIPKVVSPIPMKRFVLRSSTPISSPTRSKSTEGLLNNRTSTEKRRRESTDAQFSPKSPKNIYRRSGKARKSKKRINRPGRLNIEDIYRCYPLIGSHDSRVSAHRIVSGTDTYDVSSDEKTLTEQLNGILSFWRHSLWSKWATPAVNPGGPEILFIGSFFDSLFSSRHFSEHGPPAVSFPSGAAESDHVECVRRSESSFSRRDKNSKPLRRRSPPANRN